MAAADDKLCFGVQAELGRILNALTTETARVGASNKLNQLLGRLRPTEADDAETTDDEGGADDAAAPDAAIEQQTTAEAAKTMQYGDKEDDNGLVRVARLLSPSHSSGI